jgi:GT2 family glycosyltransferase
MKEVSVIIVSWNGRQFLQDCLVSIQKTAGLMVREVVVVDNCSADGSPEMVAKEFPEVTLIRLNENLGFARANNIGLKEVSGRWIALINSDVVLHPGCLDELVGYMAARPGVGLVGPKVFGRDGKLQRTCRRLPTLWNTLCRALALDSALPHCRLFSGREMRHWAQDTESDVEMLNGCFWLARSEAVQDVGALDERFFFYAEDVDWCKRFRDRKWTVAFVPAATITHYGGGSSACAPVRYSIELLRANLAYWRKHQGLLGFLIFYALLIFHHGSRAILRVALGWARQSSPSESKAKRQRDLACVRWLLGLPGKSLDNQEGK